MMVNVFSASSITEAHLIKNLLAQHGIAAHVAGEYLQGAFGELPLIDTIQVQVAAEDEASALQIIHDYDAGVFMLDENEK